MQIKLFLYEEINSKLLEIPDIIKSFEDCDTDLVDKALEWLNSIEELLKKNNNPAASKISIIKGKLISVKRGAFPLEIQSNGKMSVSKLKQVYTVNILGEVNNLLSQLLNPIQQRILESENLVKHMLAIAYQKNLLKEYYVKSSVNKDIRSLYSAMNGDVDLNPWITKLKSLMGMYEALIILDRAIIDFI